MNTYPNAPEYPSPHETNHLSALLDRVSQLVEYAGALNREAQIVEVRLFGNNTYDGGVEVATSRGPTNGSSVSPGVLDEISISLDMLESLLRSHAGQINRLATL